MVKRSNRFIWQKMSPLMVKDDIILSLKGQTSSFGKKCPNYCGHFGTPCIGQQHKGRVFVHIFSEVGMELTDCWIYSLHIWGNNKGWLRRNMGLGCNVNPTHITGSTDLSLWFYLCRKSSLQSAARGSPQRELMCTSVSAQLVCTCSVYENEQARDSESRVWARGLFSMCKQLCVCWCVQSILKIILCNLSAIWKSHPQHFAFVC